MKNAAYTVLGIILAQANNREEQTKASDAFRKADAECSTDKELLTITTGWLLDGLKYGNWPWTKMPTAKPSDSKPVKTGIPLIEEQLYNAKAGRRDAMQRLDATAAKLADGEVAILERRLARAKARESAAVERKYETTLVKHEYEPGERTLGGCMWCNEDACDHGARMVETTLVKHDYEPGEGVAPMQSDPSCRVCGMIKQSMVHD